VQHVLPRGFVKIRHYGLLAARDREARLALCRQLLLPATAAARCPTADALAETDVTPARERFCPQCGSRRLRVRELPKEVLPALRRHADSACRRAPQLVAGRPGEVGRNASPGQRDIGRLTQGKGRSRRKAIHPLTLILNVPEDLNTEETVPEVSQGCVNLLDLFGHQLLPSDLAAGGGSRAQ
jgi:hypothetical protein